MTAQTKSPADATLFDWTLFAVIILVSGSSFALIRGAVETMPPAAVAVGRLWIGAGFLYAVMRLAGRDFPSLVIRAKGRLTIRRSWRWMIAVGVSGNVLPFFLFPWAQRHIESGLAGIYMAFMPIWTVVLASLFAYEPMTARRFSGFALGFAGVVILMGPDVFKGALDSDLRAQGALLLATTLYAVSAVLARRAPPIRPRVFAAGMMLSAAVTATPGLFLVDSGVGTWSLTSMASVAGLGVFSTGLAGFIIITVIRRAGAGFMSLTNYVIPLWAVGLGAVLYQERLPANAFLALFVILAGVAVSQRNPYRRRLFQTEI